MPDIHAICAESRGHLEELRAISNEMNLLWLGVGNVLCLEDPLPRWDLTAYAELRERTTVPIASPKAKADLVNLHPGF